MTEKVLSAFANALKITNADEWVATLRTEDGSEFLADDIIASKIAATVSERVTAAKNESRKSGQAEQNSKIRSFVKAQGFDNPDTLQGADLLNAYSAWKDEQTPDTPTGAKLEDMDIDALRKLPQVKQIELLAQQGAGQKFQTLQKEYTDYKTDMDTYKRNSEAQKVDERAFAKTVDYVNALGVVLTVEGSEISSSDRLETIYHRIRSMHKIGLDSKGEPIVLSEDGSPMNDSFGDPIQYKNIVLDVSKKLYPIRTQDPNHSGSGIQPSAFGKPGEKVPQKLFGTRLEYDTFMKVTTDRTQRAEAATSWQYHSDKAAGN